MHEVVEVRPVASRRDLDLFVRFPWKIYAHDPVWVPPLLLEVKGFLSRKHPFLLHGSAAQFLAWRNGEVVGRILVSDDPNYNAEHGSNVGCFGMFESIDNADVARALIDRAKQWLKERGRSEMMGPIDYSTNYPCGLLISGFDTPPRLLMNHHPPYYQRLLEAAGLNKAKDLYCWWFLDAFDMVAKWKQKAERLAKRGSVTIRSVRREDLDTEIDHCKDIYNKAWERNWGFVKMSDPEFHRFAHELQQMDVPTDLLLLAEVDGQPAGFSMTLPDLNEAIRPLNGRLTTWGLPIGYFRLRANIKRIKTARMVTLGVIDRYRRRGVTELLILHTLDQGKNVIGYQGAELSWTLEDNELINRTIEAVGGLRYKTYRIYQTPVA